jgi:imidazolonepropionase-like amidohydrolase
LIAGKPITITGGHFHFASFEADGIDEMIKAVRIQIREGADFIKIMNDGSSATSKYARRTSQYKGEELEAAVYQAHKLGKKVAVHAHSTAAIQTAVYAGVDSIEHCYWLGEDGGFNYDEKIVQEILKKGIFIIPTLSVGYPRSKRERIDPDLRPLEERLDELMDMYKKGIKLVSGGDEGGRNTLITENVYTLELFVQAGLSPFQALQTSTKVAAECLGIDQFVGTIEEGKKADLLIVQGDPLENISNLWNIRKVIKDGKFVN